MAEPQKTVFISYRRKVSFGIARAIFMDLRENGYDVFMDVANLDSGKFNPAILNEIETRAHFLVILESGSLNRCIEDGDWLRREIEYAMHHQRNIVPVMVEGFKFDDRMRRYLTGKLNELPDYNALPLRHDLFEECMLALRGRFLKTPGCEPDSGEEAAAQQTTQEIVGQSEQENLIKAKECYNNARVKWKSGDYQGAIADCSEAIRLRPEFAEMYRWRGIIRDDLGDLAGAFADYTESIRLNPHDAYAYNNRGLIRARQGDPDGAIADYNEALRLNPYYALPYHNRGLVRAKQGDLEGAIADYTLAIRLDLQYAHAYFSRGSAYRKFGDLDAALADYNAVLRLNPDDAGAYNNRGLTHEKKGDYERALADYEAALRIDPQFELARNNRDSLLKVIKGQ